MLLAEEAAGVDLKGWASVVQAVTALVAAFFGKEFLLKLWQAKKTNAAVDTFAQGAALQAALQKLRMRLKANRSSILEAHNGGKDMSTERPLYTSLRYAARDDFLPAVIWENEAVDEEYWQLLKDIQYAGGNGYVELETDKITVEVPAPTAAATSSPSCARARVPTA